MINDIKKIIADQNMVRSWLVVINEKDDKQIQEVTDLIRLNPEYRSWIVKYAIDNHY